MEQAFSSVYSTGTTDASLTSRQASGQSSSGKNSINIQSATHASKTAYQPKGLDYDAEITNFKHSGGESELARNLNPEQYSPLYRDKAEGTDLEPLKYLDQFLSNSSDETLLFSQCLHTQQRLLASGLHFTCIEAPNVQCTKEANQCKAPSCVLHAHRSKTKTYSLNILSLRKAPNQSYGSLGEVSHCRNYSDPFSRFNAVFSITTSVVLLLALLQLPIAMATNLSSREFHPSQVLSSSSPMPSDEASPSAGNRISSQVAGTADEVKEDEVSDNPLTSVCILVRPLVIPS